MTTNDKPLTRNYDSDKENSEIDSDIRVLKTRLTANSGNLGVLQLNLTNRRIIPVN